MKKSDKERASDGIMLPGFEIKRTFYGDEKISIYRRGTLEGGQFDIFAFDNLVSKFFDDNF